MLAVDAMAPPGDQLSRKLAKPAVRAATPQQTNHPAALTRPAQPQQLSAVNKQNPTDKAGNGIRPETVTETMTKPEFVAEQLPELWQQTGPFVVPEADEWADAWDAGVDAMFRRCETYPEHAKIRVVLYGMEDDAWYYRTDIADHGDDMLQEADTEQLLQALAHEQQHTPHGGPITDQILMRGTVEHLTGPVIEQLRWVNHFFGGEVELWDDEEVLRRHIIEHVQQHLLGGNKHAWTVFFGIISEDMLIGGAAKIAHAIETQHQP